VLSEVLVRISSRIVLAALSYLTDSAIRKGLRVHTVKRFGFHTFRHSLTSWLMANGENPQIVRAMLRWTNLNMLAHYAHGFKADKLEAQGAVLKRLVRSDNTTNRESERELGETESS
jgi:integrase